MVYDFEALYYVKPATTLVIFTIVFLLIFSFGHFTIATCYVPDLHKRVLLTLFFTLLPALCAVPFRFPTFPIRSASGWLPSSGWFGEKATSLRVGLKEGRSAPLAKVSWDNPPLSLTPLYVRLFPLGSNVAFAVPSLFIPAGREKLGLKQ
jgi:hypothetical protein